MPTTLLAGYPSDNRTSINSTLEVIEAARFLSEDICRSGSSTAGFPKTSEASFPLPITRLLKPLNADDLFDRRKYISQEYSHQIRSDSQMNPMKMKGHQLSEVCKHAG